MLTFYSIPVAPSGITIISDGGNAPNVPKVCDVNMSPDGSRLAARSFYLFLLLYLLLISLHTLAAILSDALGRIFLYGMDNPDRFDEARMYPEQYYQYDYQEIQHDEYGWAIDVQTQQVNDLITLILCSYLYFVVPNELIRFIFYKSTQSVRGLSSPRPTHHDQRHSL